VIVGELRKASAAAFQRILVGGSGELMKSVAKLFATAIAFVALTGFGSAIRVDYVLTPIMDHGALKAVQVDLIFGGGGADHAILELPDSWGGQTELYHAIQNLRPISNVTISDGADAAHKVLRYSPGSLVHVQYVVFQDWIGEPQAENGNPYRPVIQPGYFHIIGNAFLAIPLINGSTPVHVHLRGLPAGWTYASDLEHRGLVLGDVNASVAVAGDYRVLNGHDRNIRVAIRGRWSFSDADFVGEVERIISAERSFWGDRSTPYLVTVTQLTSPNDSWLSIGGTGLGDAFAFFATPNADIHQIARTLAHEGIHTWIPALIGGNPDGPAEAPFYWLSEGFTDFYTGRLMVRGGLWTPTEFAADLNRMLTEYASSPVKTAPNSRVAADFWNDEQVQKLPYQRGRMLATIWDARLRALGQGRDMDDVMFEMRRRAAHRDPLKAAEMLPLVLQHFGVDPASDIERYVTNGESIILPADLFAPCGTITTRQVPVFSRGFDIQATQTHNNIIAGVDPTLPAYAAGMRDGMVLVRRDGGAIGDSEHEIAYVVRDGGAERTIRYMPQGHGQITLQALVLDSDLTGDKLAQCENVLSGK
jgi:predicted metalloprotease with PDZ domain